MGEWAVQFLSSIHADVCFLGTAGLLHMSVPSSHSYEALSAKRAMVKQSDMVYVLADSHKFLDTGVHVIVEYGQIDAIITDHHINPDIYASMSKSVQKDEITDCTG